MPTHARLLTDLMIPPKTKATPPFTAAQYYESPERAVNAAPSASPSDLSRANANAARGRAGTVGVLTLVLAQPATRAT